MKLDYRLDQFYEDDDDPEVEGLSQELKNSERYKEFTEIGLGGSKKVFKAYDSYSQRYVAYAELRDEVKELLNDSFIREARLTSKLSHPNIIPVYDVGYDDKRGPFFTMELKSGKEFSEILSQLKSQDPAVSNQYNLMELLQVFLKICDAMAFAHSKKVIHLDLKPENIQIGSYGEVIVCDWGLSKIYDRQYDTEDINQLLLTPEILNNMTLNGQIKGTPGFMAPEQIDGSLKSPKTDIYSLGCMLFNILTYRIPFEGVLEDILKNTLSGKMSYSIDESPNEIPEGLKAVCLKAMEVKPEERYESVQELKAEIEKFMHGYVTSAEHAGLGKIVKLFILRNKAMAIVTAAALITIIIGSIISFAQIKEREQQALKQKDKAETNLNLFIKEKDKVEKANIQFQKSMVKNMTNYFHLRFEKIPKFALQKAIKGLEDFLLEYPGNKDILAALGYHYFIKHDFTQARKCFAKSPGIYEYMVPLAAKYEKIKGEKLFLSATDYLALLKEFPEYKTLHVKLMMVYVDYTKDFETHAKAIKIILEILNPNWTEKVFSYTPKTQELIIGGKNISVLRDSNAVLINLPIKRLIIKNTDVSHFMQLNPLSIQELDISGCPILQKGNIPITLSTLKEITVDPSQVAFIEKRFKGIEILVSK